MKNNKNYKLRDYQKQGKNKVLESIRAKFRQKIDLEKNNSNFKSADLIEMATWSWKTLLSWEIISHIFEVKDRLGERLNFWWLNVLVLTNRIDWANQFYDDWFIWRNGKKPIFSEKILSRSEAQIFHSKWEDLNKFENFEENDKHKIFFSTYQTADLKDLSEKLENIDIIIIDEAHNVGFKNNTFFEVLKNLEKKWRNWNKPEIIALTATPDNVTKENFWESIFTFWLPEYLASEYSPNVNYQVVTGTSADNEEIKNLEEKIKSFKNISNFDLKKEKIEELEADLEKIFQKSPSSESLCKDILEKISENNEIKKSVIFVNSIEEAEEIAVILNSLSDSNSAFAYHSKSKEKNILENFSKSDSEKKILICVDKVNESIDLPVVENIIFYRNTNSWKIFLQQFGRGLRGNWSVNYFDYVWSLKNFSWIWNIYREYKEFVKNKKKSKNDESEIIDEIEENDEKFNFYWWNLKTKNFEVNLYDLIEKISNLKENAELTEEDVIDFFKEKDLEYWQGLTIREIKNIKIKWYWIASILSLFWIEWNPINKNIWFNFLEEIFNIKIKNIELTKEDVINFFREKDLEYWLSLTNKEKKDIKIKGSWLTAISSLFWINWNSLISNKEVWFDFLEEIFKKEEINKYRLTEEDVIDFFKEKDLEYWQGLTKRERAKIKIKWYWIVAISNSFWIEWNPISNKNIWLVLLEKIFNTKIEIIEKEEISKKYIIDFFNEKDLEYWEAIPPRERKIIKIKWYWLNAISSLFWVEWNPTSNKDIWLEFLWKIFWNEEILKLKENSELTKKDVIDFFNEKDLKYWFHLISEERAKIKIKENWIVSISNLFWIKWNPIKNKEIWIKFLEEIFWDEELIKFKKSIELTEREVIDFFKEKDLEYWKNLKWKEKEKIIIKENSLRIISSLFWIKWDPINNKRIWYEFLEKIFETKIEKN